MKCERCDYFGVHEPSPYARAKRLCLYSMMRYDCRRFIPTKHRSDEVEAAIQADLASRAG